MKCKYSQQIVTESRRTGLSPLHLSKDSHGIENAGNLDGNSHEIEVEFPSNVRVIDLQINLNLQICMLLEELVDQSVPAVPQNKNRCF